MATVGRTVGRGRDKLVAAVLLIACACSKASSGDDAGASSSATAYVAHDLGAGRCTAVDDKGDVLGLDASGNAFLLAATGTSTPLGSLSGVAGMYATAIDPTGATIVGFGLTTTTHQAATHSAGASWTATSQLASTWASPSAVNAQGAIAGTLQSGSPDASGVPTFHAFLLSGTVKDLGTIGGRSSAAYGMSADGKVVGSSQASDESTHAFLYAAGAMKDLGTLGGDGSAAYGVNSAGTVVGVAETASGEGHAFLFAHASLQDLSLGYARSEARGVSEAGVIVGNWVSSAGADVPFVYVDGKATALAVSDSAGHAWASVRAEAISPSGLIVGWGRPVSTDAGASATHCVLWRSR